MKLILASSSKYRKALFDKKKIPVLALKPPIDEESLKAQELKAQGAMLHPKSLGIKLAEAKAQSIFKDHPEDIVIGSDQVCVSPDNKILNKPDHFDKNLETLQILQGKSHYLYTCVCILSSQHKVLFTDSTRLSMKNLSLDEIKAYINKDQAYDCAGGYKFETESGRQLFSHVESSDLTAIQGLPMAQVLSILKKDFKFRPPKI